MRTVSRPRTAARRGRTALKRTRCEAGAAGSEAEGSRALHGALAGATVFRASDARPLELTSLWGEQERVVVAFLRSFG